MIAGAKIHPALLKVSTPTEDRKGRERKTEREREKQRRLHGIRTEKRERERETYELRRTIYNPEWNIEK